MEACHLPHLQSAEDTTCRPSVCVPAGLHLAIFSPGHSNFPRKQEGGNAEHIPLFHPNHQKRLTTPGSSSLSVLG